jgi:hypothetical protein
MATKPNKAKLLAQMARVRRELDKIEGAETAKKNKKLIGKYFKYPRNCYSCPEKESDYWPVYHKVLYDDGGLHGMTFQTDSHGMITIKFDDYVSLSGCVEISAREFLDAWLEVKRKIALASVWRLVRLNASRE